MNNSLGGLQEYMDAFDKNPGAMGGAIWEWQDQAIWNRRDPAHPFLAYGGGFGDVPNDGVFILKGGGVFADRTRNPKYFEVKHGYQWIKTAARDLAHGGLTVRNKYAFTPLSRFLAAWSVTRDGQPIAHGDLPLPEVAPGGSAPLDVPLPPGSARPAGRILPARRLPLQGKARLDLAGHGARDRHRPVRAAFAGCHGYTLPFARMPRRSR